MKCRKCGSEMRIWSEQVGVQNGIAVYNNFGYCDRCKEKVNIDALESQYYGRERKHSTLSICACVLSIFVCTLPIGFIIALIDLCQNDKTKKHIGSWFSVCIGGILIFLFLYKKPETENTDSSNENVEYAQETSTYSEEEPEPKEGLQHSDLSESEYKNSCNELYYDDIFFGDENLEGQLVKLDLFVSEYYFFTNDDMQKEMINDFYYEYNLKRDFLKCCVRREGENSYVGRQIDVFFSEDYRLDYSLFSAGQNVTVYAEVVRWSNNTMDGYNTVSIVPRFYE